MRSGVGGAGEREAVTAPVVAGCPGRGQIVAAADGQPPGAHRPGVALTAAADGVPGRAARRGARHHHRRDGQAPALHPRGGSSARRRGPRRHAPAVARARVRRRGRRRPRVHRRRRGGLPGNRPTRRRQPDRPRPGRQHGPADGAPPVPARRRADRHPRQPDRPEPGRGFPAAAGRHGRRRRPAGPRAGTAGRLHLAPPPGRRRGGRVARRQRPRRRPAGGRFRRHRQLHHAVPAGRPGPAHRDTRVRSKAACSTGWPSAAAAWSRRSATKCCS